MINIRDILKEKGHDIFWVPPDATVYESLGKMSARNVGALMVMDDEKLLGVITERDYMKKIILKNRSSKNTLVKEIMTSNPVFVTLSDSIDEALLVMTKQRCRHLPVIDQEKITGVVSIGDLVKAKISDLDSTIKYLNDYIGS
ncbi:MAG: CBS domain-containing protein [Candidatus Aminicenantes bacterium]|nr:CBS domain-containing protein [Candidatus Aminicenantes bacterium]